MSQKWKPEVIVGGAQPQPDDTNPVTAALGHALDHFVADWCKRHSEVTREEALIVLMQFTSGMAVSCGCPEIDYVRCLTELYQMEQAARNKDGA